jgi:hypothetical protein
MATKTKQTRKQHELLVTDFSTLDIGIEGVEPIAAFKFGKGNDVGIVSISEFNGKKALDVRRFYADDDLVLRPTAKGLRIPLEVAADVVRALHAAIETIESGE